MALCSWYSRVACQPSEEAAIVSRVRRAAPRVSLAGDRRGAIATEYVIIVGTVAIGASVALAALGPVLVGQYEFARNLLILPVP